MRCRGRLLWCVLLIMAHSYKSSGFGSESVPVFEPGPGCFCYEQVGGSGWLAHGTQIQTALDGTDRLFISDQRGVIWIIEQDGTRITEPFVNLTGTPFLLAPANGLMAFTFHPNYTDTGKVYLYYIADNQGQMEQLVTEVQVSDNNPNLVDLETERILLRFPIPEPDHTGGAMLFGPDGYLYISVGDSWAPENSQNKSTYLGAVHRVDVESRTGDLEYGIPPDNPYLSDPDALPEVYAIGVRNPWKGTMDWGDPETGAGYGRIILGDVGQDYWEEVDMLHPGANYGWSAWEGPLCLDPDLCLDIGPTVAPLMSYNHTQGQCVIGGHVYRGANHPEMNGWYTGADYGVSRFFGLYETSPDVWEWDWIPTCSSCPDGLTDAYPYYIHALGVNEQGELYFTSTDMFDPYSNNGTVSRIVAFNDSSFVVRNL